jgi:hypothetical protein
MICYKKTIKIRTVMVDFQILLQIPKVLKHKAHGHPRMITFGISVKTIATEAGKLIQGK